MTHIVLFETKKALNNAIQRGVNVRFNGQGLDQSVSVEELKPGQTIYCTNEKRTWFAKVTKHAGAVCVQ